MRELKAEEFDKRQETTGKTAAFLGDIVQAVREHRNADVTGIVMKARKDGVPLTQKQIHEAVQTAMQTAVQRTVHQAPKADRPTLFQQGKGVENQLGR